MHTFFNPDKEGWLWKQGNPSTLSQQLTSIPLNSMVLYIGKERMHNINSLFSETTFYYNRIIHLIERERRSN